MDRFSTSRLQAERVTAAHWLDLRRMDEDEQFMALLGGVRDKAGTIAYLEMNVKHWADHGFGMWMLREATTAELVGRAILRHLDVEGVDEVEVGYGFMPAYWGRGLATEIACECVRIGREQLHLRSMVAITTPANIASQRVMQKAGLVYERDIVHAGVPHRLFRIEAKERGEIQEI
ncbi:MAG: GNAT family N-acetyltransferase [Vicinamibacterales bacterium]